MLSSEPTPESVFAEHLQKALPLDLPNRDHCIAGSAHHLALMAEANQQFNLTRISSPHEAAIKHVADSVWPWLLFASAKHVVDAGSGAGFPGIPLALVLPGTQFTLVESRQKKAAFLTSTVSALGLSNVTVVSDRVESWILGQSPQTVVTARALAHLTDAIPLFAKALTQGTRVLLYKGPEVQVQIAEATLLPKNRKYSFKILQEYELPQQLGSRCIVELALSVKPRQPR